MNLTPEQDDMIRDDLALNLQVETLRKNIFDGIPQPTEHELREYYSINKDRFKDED